MKTITYNEIKELTPCYDPIRYIPIDWTGTLIDILSMENIPAKDRLWVCVRHTFLTDKRVKECNDVVEAYLNGNMTKKQLNVVRSAANAVWSSESAAESAAWSAARSAASAASAAEKEQCLFLIKILKGDYNVEI